MALAFDRARPRPAAPIPACRRLGAMPPRAVVPAIVLAGVALRVWRALANGPTFDESFTAMVGRRPSATCSATSAPLTRIRPSTTSSGRRWPGSAPAISRCGRRRSCSRAWPWPCSPGGFSPRGWPGVFAVALFAFSTFQVWHGGEARMYALLQLLGVLAVRRGRALAAVAEAVACLGARRDGARRAVRPRVRPAARPRAPRPVRDAARPGRVAGPRLARRRRVRCGSWLGTDRRRPARATTGRRGCRGPRRRRSRARCRDSSSWRTAWRGSGSPSSLPVASCSCVQDRGLARLWLTFGALPFAAAAAVGLFGVVPAAPDARRGVVGAGARGRVPARVGTTDAGATWRRGRVVDPRDRAHRHVLVPRIQAVGLRPLDRASCSGSRARRRDRGPSQPRYGILVDWRFGVRGDRATRDVRFDPIPETDARPRARRRPDRPDLDAHDRRQPDRIRRVTVPAPSRGPTTSRRSSASPLSPDRSAIRVGEHPFGLFPDPVSSQDCGRLHHDPRRA